MKQNNEKDGRLPEFKNRLNELMQGMNTTEFAQKLDLSRQTVGFYLNGDRIPDARTVIQICEKCNVSSDWLLGIAPKNTRTPDLDEQAICQKTGLSDVAVRNLIGTHEYGKKEFVKAIDCLLQDEDQWEFFAPDGGFLNKDRSLLEVIADYLYSPIPTGMLALHKDGIMTDRADVTRGESGLYFLPADVMGVVPAKELVDNVRINRIIDVLKKTRDTLRSSVLDVTAKGKED